MYIVSLVVILSNWVCDNWLYRFPIRVFWLLLEQLDCPGDVVGDPVGEQVVAHAISRTAPGTSVVRRTFYYYITDNALEPDIVVRLYDRFMVEGCLGSGAPNLRGSKSLQPEKQGEPRGAPVQTLLALRGWALWRMQQAPAFLEKVSRARFWQEELTSLQDSISQIG